MKFIVVLALTSLASVLAGPTFRPVGSRRNLNLRDIPDPVSLETAKEYLANLTVEEESNSPAYDRDRFEHWIIVDGACDAREYVLARDGKVTTDDNCKVTEGTWTSPYDGVNTTLASDLDIDHVVPLKEAWVSGARNWDDEQRKKLANDITNPQLVAVTDNLNQAKGDQDIAEWVPPLEGYVCKYVRAWIQVKHEYELSIDEAEKTALDGYIDGC